MKYIDASHKLILPQIYLQNLEKYQYIDTIYVESSSLTLDAIDKDQSADFYRHMILKGIEPRWNENLIDLWVEGDDLQSDYFVLDTDDLYDFLDIEMFEFYLNFIDLLDVSDKFSLLQEMYIRGGSQIVKVKRCLRNLKKYNYAESQRDVALSQLDNYSYSGLNFSF